MYPFFCFYIMQAAKVCSIFIWFKIEFKFIITKISVPSKCEKNGEDAFSCCYWKILNFVQWSFTFSKKGIDGILIPWPSKENWWMHFCLLPKTFFFIEFLGVECLIDKSYFIKYASLLSRYFALTLLFCKKIF